MTFVSLALLGSRRGWRKPEIANVKSTSSGPNNGERLHLKDDLNKHINGIIQAANGDPQKIFDKVVPTTSLFPNLTGIEDWLYQNFKGDMAGVPTGVRRGAIAPCMMLCGQCVGTDKIGHFFEEGKLYQQVAKLKSDSTFAVGLGQWLEGLVPTDPAVLAWIQSATLDITWSGGTMKGIKLSDLFGAFGDGTLSANKLPVGMADLEANLAGLAFWDALGKDGKNSKFNICDYVKDKWDENKNPNTPAQKRP